MYRNVKKLYDRPLKYMPYAQAGVIVRSWGVRLVSYITPVIELYNDGWLICFGLYSRTTRKHISAFMREYVVKYDYSVAKKCYEKNVVFNVNTAETMTVEEYFKLHNNGQV